MPNAKKPETFSQVVAAAIRELTETGFDSMERVNYWKDRIRRAAEASLVPEKRMEQVLRDVLTQTYHKLIERGGIASHHPGVSRYTLNMVAPQLRAELDKRIMASASLIKLNRAAAIDNTLRRFEGWSTSIPKGGTKQTDKRETSEDIRKGLQRLSFHERRLAIDQGSKLIASINEVVAKGGGAIAMKWHSNFRTPNYDYREQHKLRDDKYRQTQGKHGVWAIRGNWAIEKGLMKAGPNGFYDTITAVAEEPYCRCSAVYVYSIRSLPDGMVTAKGRQALADARASIAGSGIRQDQFHTI